MSFLSSILGDPNAKVIKNLQPIVDKINALEDGLKAKTDEELKASTLVFRDRLGVKIEESDGSRKITNTKTIEEEAKILDEILPEAFATMRESARRVLGQRHYDVQLIGGMVLHQGQISEMKTGEGKTLVATLPLYLNALTGRGVQLVTVNDYLSRVGAGWMAPACHALGLSVAVIIHDRALIFDPEHNDETQFDDRLRHFREVPRRQAYACDILYGTNNEFGFDYLRDNMVQSFEEKVQRELFFAIVDEVDSILIDEARTPLIISGAVDESTDRYYQFAELVRPLVENEDYNLDEKDRAATFTESGINKMEKALGIENIYATGGVKEVHHLEQALKASVLFKIDKDYVVKDGEVIIVDEFTGRLMQGRRYSEGLHQAIEAKEKVKIQRESQTLATITFQNYFRMYKKLAGMTGTALTEAEEFHKIYSLETVAIPTNKPLQRKDVNDQIYANEKGKYDAVVAEIKRRSALGQPVLVGTISIEKNEVLSQLLELEGVKHELLNAKNHEREAQIIAQAGKFGSVTIATNMAGRGVDIILGGTPFDKDEYDKVVALGGLHVVGTERHESRRIDNQLRGRAGRQGDPGSSCFYVSMDDELMRIFGGERMQKMMKTMKFPEDMPIENPIISKSIESAQKKVEGNNFDIRKHLVEYDDVINKHRQTIYDKRNRILAVAEDEADKESLTKMILDMVELEIEQVVSFHTAPDNVSDWDLKEIEQTAKTIFPLDAKMSEDILKMSGEHAKLDKIMVRTKIIDTLVGEAKIKYAQAAKITEEVGMSWKEVEKNILLRSMDLLWIEHLETMDYMRRGIGLRGYGQHDPLVEYKKEAFRMYSELNTLIQKEVVYSIFKVGGIGQMMSENVFGTKQKFTAPAKEMTETNSGFAGLGGDEGHNSAATFGLPQAKDHPKDATGHKIGRNDPCYCGSGKKYKNCHGA
jgi:preprotein translocase subunit SecA